MIFIKKRCFPHFVLAPQTVIQEGRLTRFKVSDGTSSLIVYTAHLLNLSNVSFPLFKTFVLKGFETAELGGHFLCLPGDFKEGKAGNSDIDHHFPLAPPVARPNEGTLNKSL